MSLLPIAIAILAVQMTIPPVYVGHYVGSWSSSVPITDSGTMDFHVSSTGVISGTYTDTGTSGTGTIGGRVFSNGIFTMVVNVPNVSPLFTYSYTASGPGTHTGTTHFAFSVTGTGTYGGVSGTSFTTAFVLTRS